MIACSLHIDIHQHGNYTICNLEVQYKVEILHYEDIRNPENECF